MKTTYDYKAKTITIEVSLVHPSRWHFKIAIEDPPPPAHGSIIGEVETMKFETEESVLDLAKATAEREINKATY